MDLSWIMGFVPDRWKPQALMGLLVFFGICSLTVSVWKPPAATSRWLPIYKIINSLAFNFGWAVNAYQPDKQPVMTPIGKAPEVRAAVASKFNIPYEDTKP